MRKHIANHFAFAALSVAGLPVFAHAQVAERTLNWPGKSTGQIQASAAPAPQQTPPVQPIAPSLPAPAAAQSPAVSAPIAPKKAVASRPVASAPAPAHAYEVPATSKYAKAIKEARAAQNPAPAPVAMAPIPNPQNAPQKTAPAPKQAPKSPPAPASAPIAKATAPMATVPEVSTPLSAEQTDHVFIPGEQITNDATQRPRYYSLHRQYGMTPDTIDVPKGENGALLEVPYMADEKPDGEAASNTAQP